MYILEQILPKRTRNNRIMRVIGIDPGYDRLGFAIMEYRDGKECLLFSGCIETDRQTTASDRLLTIGQKFTELLIEKKIDTLAIEKLFFNQNQKTVMGVAEVRGCLIYLAKLHNCNLHEFGPQEIKVAVTGYGKSDKRAVIEMVKRLVLEAPSNALDDEYDAIAVGLTCLAHFGRNQ
jgi:crossover junction endodeoxyribonuclease RuvC